jgi:hypothetical protein
MSEILVNEFLNRKMENWSFLSKNPNAIHLLEANPDKIIWNSLCLNCEVFENIYTYVLK